MSEEILMGRWDCPYCDTVGLKGDVYSCPNCDSDRPSDEDGNLFYLPEEDEVITDAQGIADAKKGADWECDYCGDWISATRDFCHKCTGGSVDEGRRQTTETREGRGNSFKRSHKPKESAKPPRTPPIAKSFVRQFLTTPPKGSFGPEALLPLSVVAGLFIFLVVMVLPNPTMGEVAYHSWIREQATQVYRRGIVEEGWSTPSGAYEIDSLSKFHHNDQVIDYYRTDPVYSTRKVANGTRPVYSTRRVKTGTEAVYSTRRVQTGSSPIYSTRTTNMGNGRFKREKYQSGRRPTYRTERYQSGTRDVYSTERYQSGVETVYRDERYQSGTKQTPIYKDVPRHQLWYTYKVDRWVSGPTRRKSGRGVETAWPSREVEYPGRERMRGRSEKYTLHFKEVEVEEGKATRTFKKDLQESVWRSWADGERVVLQIGMGGRLSSFKRPGEEK